MQSNFSPSINIGRDLGKTLSYIPTENAINAFDTIFRRRVSGAKSYCLIGTYGTGKSAFLLALMGFLQGKNTYFPSLNGHAKPTEFLYFQGDYASLIEQFAEKVSAKEATSKEVIKAFKNLYKTLEKEGKAVVIVVDEFGKFLEYAGKNEPEKELYFVQQLAELANDEKKQITFITTLHQEFDAYASQLSKRQIQEWEKVKGRLLEIPFNEPVEQLLQLASNYLQSNKDEFPSVNHISEVIQIIEQAQVFPLRNKLDIQFAKGLAPFDILSAGVLAQALQRYGQNERSLFTFLESDANYGLRHYDESNPYFNLACVFDYLIDNFHSYLTTSRNSDYIQWAALRKAIERVEGHIQQDVVEAVKIVKSIGLLNIFASAAAKIDGDFLEQYAKYSLGIENSASIIGVLEEKQIIRFIRYKNSYILFEGSDLNIDLALQQAESKVQVPENIVPVLKTLFQLPHVIAKQIQYIKGTPRLFRFEIVNEPVVEYPRGEFDGVIQLIFGTSNTVQETSSNSQEAVLFGVSKSVTEIRETLIEIEKVKKVIAENQDDSVALRELKGLRLHLIDTLNELVSQNIYNGGFDWYFHGEKVELNSTKAFNKFLSTICEKTYPDTPVFKNELMNRHSLSSAIANARGHFFEALVTQYQNENFGFPEDKYPPEKTIYQALIKQTGIHRKNSLNNYDLFQPQDNSFQKLWDASEAFFNKAKSKRRSLKDFFEMFTEPPLKLKNGFVNFWLPIYLFIKRNDYALYHEGVFVPELNRETIDIIYKYPQRFEFKAFDLEGIRLEIFNQYRVLIQQDYEAKPTKQTFIDTIKPFLVFYNQLKPYVKQTKIGLSTEAQRFRETISKTTDAEKAFFEDFPNALGFRRLTEENSDGLKLFADKLQRVIVELREAYQKLVNRFEEWLCLEVGVDTIDFEVCKGILQKRYKNIKKQQLLGKQRVFLAQITSPLDDRESWLNAVANSIMGKGLDKMLDAEEVSIQSKIGNMLKELDNLQALSNMTINEEKEEAFKIDITSFKKGTVGYKVRLPKSKIDGKLVSALKEKLGDDTRMNIAILTKLLEEQLKDDES